MRRKAGLLAGTFITTFTGSARRAGATSTLPQFGAIQGRWRTDTIAPVADGTSITSWTDSINGRVITPGGVAGTYKNNSGYGGKPSINFNGTTQYYTGSTPEVTTAFTSGEYTIMAVYGNALATTYGFIASAGTAIGVNLVNNGTYMGGSYSGNNGSGFPATSGFNTALCAHSTSYLSGQKVNHYAANGSVYQTLAGTTPGAAATQLYVGGYNTTVAYKGDLMEIIVWNRKLTLAEQVQAERVLRDYYGQTYPWATTGYYTCFQGDSITNGYGLSGFPAKTWPFLVSQNLGLKAWSNLGWIGATPQIDLTIAQSENVAGISAITGVLTKHTYWEFYNAKGVSTNPFISSACYTATVAMLQYLKGTPGDKVMFGTTVDYANRGVEKGYMTAYWDGAVTPNGTAGATLSGLIDYYVPLHLNSIIGVNSACNNTSPYGAAFNNVINTVSFTGSVTSSQLVLGTASPIVVGSNLRYAGYSPSSQIKIGAYQSGGTGAGTVGAIYALGGTPPVTLSSQSMNGDSGDGIHMSDYGATVMATLWPIASL